MSRGIEAKKCPKIIFKSKINFVAMLLAQTRCQSFFLTFLGVEENPGTSLSVAILQRLFEQHVLHAGMVY